MSPHWSSIWLWAVARFIVIAIIAMAGLSLFTLVVFGNSVSKAQDITAAVVIYLGAAILATLETRRFLRKQKSVQLNVTSPNS
jgi:ACR3 family arsenite efflux pump ArsB